MDEVKRSLRQDSDYGSINPILANVTKAFDLTRRRAPYQGATGYAPMSAGDSNDTMATVTNPYDMLRDILRDQLRAEVIGAFLENTSLLDGTLTIGGALVLRRIQATKQMVILGESLQVRDEDEVFGNEGLTGGSTVVVECDADEAIGISLACEVPLQVERTVWLRGAVMAAMQKVEEQIQVHNAPRGALPIWGVVDPEISVLTEGESSSLSEKERVSPIRIPRTSVDLFTEITRSPPLGTSSDMFPTDNPIRSLKAYDELNNDGKVRTLLGMSNFDGRLPRPRKLRNSVVGEANALDDLLLPLVDESVRNEYFIREAERRGDLDRVAELKDSKSRRQVAKEKAEEARRAGVEDVADWWETEAEFLATLRADPTQDEGSYSRFLDRDEWYERTRQNNANKLERKAFGNLLDGVE
jgi:hypothetical protein